MHPDVQLHHYQAALAIDSMSYEANWKAARAISDVAKQIQSKEDSLKRRRDSLYAVGRIYAERAIRADSTKPDGHYALAMVLGRLSRTKGSKERVKYAKVIFDEATRAVEIASLAALVVAGLGVLAWLLHLSGLVSFISDTILPRRGTQRGFTRSAASSATAGRNGTADSATMPATFSAAQTARCNASSIA